MTNLPIEYGKALIAKTEAWNEYQQMIERPHTNAEFEKALGYAESCDAKVKELYARWQAVGGTSDIESIEAAERFLNLVEVALTDADTVAIAVTPRPTYDELIHGAKFTDEHRAELQDWWNKKYNNKEEAKRLNVLR